MARRRRLARGNHRPSPIKLCSWPSFYAPIFKKLAQVWPSSCRCSALGRPVSANRLAPPRPCASTQRASAISRSHHSAIEMTSFSKPSARRGGKLALKKCLALKCGVSGAKRSCAGDIKRRPGACERQSRRPFSRSRGASAIRPKSSAS